MIAYPTVPDVDAVLSPDDCMPDASHFGLEAILANPMLTQRRRSSLCGLIKAGHRSSASAQETLAGQRRRSSILDLFASIKSEPTSLPADAMRRRSSFAVLMETLFSNEGIPGLDFPSVLPPGCGAGADAPLALQQRAKPTAAVPETPQATPLDIAPPQATASVTAPAAKPVKTWPKQANAAKKRKRPESAAVRSLMPRVEKRGRRNPMLEAATVGMGPEDARLEKNRLSARECRIRKKEYLSNLEKTVALYAKKEQAYEAEIAALKARLARCEQ